MPFVRPAVPADLPALEAFDEFCEVSEELLRAGGCIVAGFDDTVFAYAIISRNFYKRRFVELIFVHPDQRRKGLANVLLAYAEAAVPGQALWVSTALGNFPMQTLLNRRGYRHSGVIHDLAPVPELIYHKPPAAQPHTPDSGFPS